MRIVMMGTGTFAEPTFEALLESFGPDVVGLVTQPERDTGHKRGSTRQTGKGMANIAAAARGVAILQPDSINSPEGLAQLRALQPTLLVVAAYGQILSRDLLTIPTLGTINVHASLLPKYRGAAPVAYAILNGETQTGVTIIKVTPGLDSGDMILQEAMPIDTTDTTGSLEAKLAGLGAKLAVDAVRMYQAGPVTGTKQDPALVTKAPKIKKEFGLIDWSKPAEHIERFVRAMQPWPTAYTFFHRPGKEPMRVIVSEIVEFPVRYDPNVPHGRVFGDTSFPKSLFVTAGLITEGEERTVVEVFALQPAGKKKMSAEEFLRGYPITEGMRFGPETLS